jgi:SAM-dependent methyltransferase
VTAPPPEEVIWHDVENGAYEADLPLWEELAEAAGGPLLELGCGTGRVSLRLARRLGLETNGLDDDPELVAAARDRGRDLPFQGLIGDARDFDLGRRFGLILAPMQVIQMIGGREARAACLGCVARHLLPGGRFAAAIVEGMPEPEDGPPPMPDVREVDGWVYSSLPLDARVSEEGISVRRLRQTVSPAGGLSDAEVEIGLRRLESARLESEAEEVGLDPTGRLEVSSTDEHVGSTVVLMELKP